MKYPTPPPGQLSHSSSSSTLKTGRSPAKTKSGKKEEDGKKARYEDDENEEGGLSDDLLAAIFQFLELGEVMCVASSVCKKWFYASKSSAVMVPLIARIEGRPGTEENVQRLKDRSK